MRIAIRARRDAVRDAVRSLAEDVGTIRNELGLAVKRLDQIEDWHSKTVPEIMSTVHAVQRGVWIFAGASALMAICAGMGLWVWMQDHELLRHVSDLASTTAHDVAEEHRINERQQVQIDKQHEEDHSRGRRPGL